MRDLDWNSESGNILGVRSWSSDDGLRAFYIAAVMAFECEFCTAFQDDCNRIIHCMFGVWTVMSHGVVTTGF